MHSCTFVVSGFLYAARVNTLTRSSFLSDWRITKKIRRRLCTQGKIYHQPRLQRHIVISMNLQVASLLNRICAHWVEMAWNRRKSHWAIPSSTYSFSRTACSFPVLALHYTLRSRAHSFTHSLTHSLSSTWERGPCLWIERVRFMQFPPTVPCSSRMSMRW